jgi:endonuclease/exonuclease/phosphatase family metal-dependent hydrolase
VNWFERWTATLAVLAAVAACATGRNYTSPLGPRYAGGTGVADSAPLDPAPESLRIVTFNIQFARHIDEAIRLLRSTGPLQHADVIALQEMDAPGTARIARALGMSYVYYPATVHPATRRDFGDAILSRFPIVADEKIILPHVGRFQKTARIATATTILVGDVSIRVYSMHLGTSLDVSGSSKRDQVQTILADAAGYPRVIIAGDANSHGIGETFRAAGYLWPTEHNPRTTRFFNWDHVFTKGVRGTDGAAATGVIHDNLGASDHRPVWAVIRLRALRGDEPLSVTPRP